MAYRLLICTHVQRAKSVYTCKRIKNKTNKKQSQFSLMGEMSGRLVMLECLIQFLNGVSISGRVKWVDIRPTYKKCDNKQNESHYEQDKKTIHRDKGPPC